MPAHSKFARSSVMSRLWLAPAALGAALALGACDQSEPEPPPEEVVEDAADEAGDAIEDASDETADAIEEAGDEVEDETDGS